jgi:hypothetical protein
MTTFDEREEGFEKKFAVDAEQKFKAVARRNKMLGTWAAEKLGIGGDAAAAYAKDVVVAEFAGGDEGVVRKVAQDFAARNLSIDPAAIRAKMLELLPLALAEVKAGK